MKSLASKWALVTGASKGLGREIALVLAEAGANLIITARSADLLDAFKMEIEALGVSCVAMPGDARDNSFLASLISSGLDKKLHVLVNNAGVVDITPLDEVSDERVDELVELNLIVPIKLTKAFIGMFKERKSGIIVNVNSAGGRKPVLNHTVYCATKYGFDGFAESLKLEIKGAGIRILGICPGKMATNLFAAADRDMDTSCFIPPRQVAESVLHLINMPPECGHAEISVDRMS